MAEVFVRKDKTLSWVMGILAVVFVLAGSIFPQRMNQALQNALQFITGNFGWSFLLIVLGFVAFCLILAFSKYGNVKLGRPEDEPEYSTLSWFAMLFSAGMGIGLVFWSVAEPLSHYSKPPFGKPFSDEAIEIAMRYTFFHWGIHPWAIYGIVGLALAYFSFKKDLPMLISSTFQPILGDRIKGPIGKALDGLAVFATIFGVATSLGLGTMQINSGLKYLFNIPNSIWTNIGIVAIITILFTLSALSGIGRGIKILSNTNVALAVLLLIFMAFIGPTRFLVNLMTNTVGQYMQSFLSMSLNTDPVKQTGWVNSWTVFYWAWWIAWAPFVGGFIARISKGRTIREFVLGVLIAPVIFSFLWMGVFGGTALHLAGIQQQNIVPVVLKDIASGLFMVFHYYPFTGVLSGLALILIITFFVTSADSATFVVGMLLSHGNLEPAASTKVFWGVIQGAIAVVLLITGGLTALQTASIIAAFPFMFVMVLMAYSMIMDLRREKTEVY
ncbi:glycine betaine uptake BCCT transporter [Thermincola potens]|uniref:Choline/carnitine/betaine transporter n=1 Tax=Thermincola potens (strain JR) TaxID=635013 RepID=D5XDN2_THEPJ|nr:BCCT family transporter [Thermincola potens]ADG83778.1 choline/carnitine/betaine transporter [Thermincola potens JR]